MSTPTTVQAFRCAACGEAYFELDLAEKCCVCAECGRDVPKEDLPKHYHIGAMHRSCADARRARTEKEAFDRAEKLESWAGPVYFGGKFHRDLDSLVDALDDDVEPGAPWPEWAEVCDEEPFPSFDLDGHVGSLSEDHGVDDFDPWEYLSEGTLQTLRLAEKAFDEDMRGAKAWSPGGRYVRIPPRPER